MQVFDVNGFCILGVYMLGVITKTASTTNIVSLSKRWIRTRIEWIALSGLDSSPSEIIGKKLAENLADCRARKLASEVAEIKMSETGGKEGSIKKEDIEQNVAVSIPTKAPIFSVIDESPSNISHVRTAIREPEKKSTKEPSKPDDFKLKD